MTESSQAIYAADGTKYDISEIEKALGDITNDIVTDNFILYIHGRGKEPTKSLSQVIPKLEHEYTAKVLMFHWSPSWSGPLGYPNESAKGASQSLYQTLKDFNDCKNSKLPNIKTTLLVHSMGNIVFSDMMSTFDTNGFDGSLFDTIVLNSADADADGHDSWVNKIKFSQKVYITVNEHDGILGLSAKRQGSKRMGQAFETMFGRDFKLADNATYIDVTETGVNHRYFLKSGQEGNPYLLKIYSNILNGVPMIFKEADGKLWKGVERERKGRIFEIKA